MTRWREARPIRVHCPLGEAAHAGLCRGDVMAVDGDPVGGPLLRLLRDPDGPIGDFGAYRGVAALIPAIETFVPGPASRPTVGAAGARSAQPMVVLQSWLDAAITDEALDRVIDAIVALHPWELPVIEIGSPVRLLARR